MKLIDGKALSQKILDDLKNEIEASFLSLKLAIVLASNDPASEIYVNMKMKKAEEVGIETELIKFRDISPAEEIIEKIEELNNNSKITGILLQWPLYPTISKSDSYRIINTISPAKDADCMTAQNLGNLFYMQANTIFPATVESIYLCIENALGDIAKLQGMNVLIINNTNLVGKPLSQILTAYNATVTLANEHTKNLKEVSQLADIVVSATGQTGLLNHEYFNQDAIVIDVTSIKKDDKIVGDVIVSEELKNKISHLTPVPGGVGPLTIACLLRNLVKLSVT